MCIRLTPKYARGLLSLFTDSSTCWFLMPTVLSWNPKGVSGIPQSKDLRSFLTKQVPWWRVEGILTKQLLGIC